MRGDKASQGRWNASVAEEPGREHSSKMVRRQIFKVSKLLAKTSDVAIRPGFIKHCYRISYYLNNYVVVHIIFQGPKSKNE